MLTSCLFDFPSCLIKETSDLKNIPIHVFTFESFSEWLNNQEQSIKHQVEDAGFNAKSDTSLILRDNTGRIGSVLAGVNETHNVYDIASLPAFLRNNISTSTLQSSYFSFDLHCDETIENLTLGWGLGSYSYDLYRKPFHAAPRLHIDNIKQVKRPLAFIRAITLLRNLVNTPANDLGPAELESVASELATLHSAKIDIVKGASLTKDFPLVHTVGQAAHKDRSPRLIEINWGDKKNPLLSVVGKGVCFDTGGLDLKPSQYMGLMKKDMGGAAHALALADLIMGLDLPVRLQVIIPAVENAIGANAFRPGDVITSRKGLTVENTDTDAEGRLILADALAYAAEGQPDTVIDFATLTGSARAALGPDIPAVFTNDPQIEGQLRSTPKSVQDPLWPMPLHHDYKSLLQSSIADLTNHVSVPGDLMYSALFLYQFVQNDAYTPKWIHVDCYAWENNGRPGRPKGGKDTGLRGIFALVEQLYT